MGVGDIANASLEVVPGVCGGAEGMGPVVDLWGWW